MKTSNLVSNKGFDPCFGFRVVPAGSRIIVKIHADGDMRLVWSEAEGEYPGFGYRIHSLEEVA